MFDGGVVDFPAHHARKLVQDGGTVAQLDDFDRRRARAFALAQRVMPIGPRGDLRQVRDAHNLCAARERAKPVETFGTPELHALLQDMKDTMAEKNWGPVLEGIRKVAEQ